MKPIRPLALVRVLILLASALVGCGQRDGESHDHHSAHGDEGGHGHGEESTSGAIFDAAKGVIVSAETRKLLGIQLTIVTNRILPHRLPMTLQIFGAKHPHLPASSDHPGCDIHGSGFVSNEAATNVLAGQFVDVLRATNNTMSGVVLGVQRALTLDETEVVIGISNGAAAFRPGEFIPARIHLPQAETLPAIPGPALLRTSEGTFVYVVKNEAYLRTAVRVGAEADGWVGLKEGLLPGDQVVTTPVETLWLIELRATKGGGHSH